VIEDTLRVAELNWAWTETQGGWLAEAAEARFFLDDGVEVVLETDPGTTMIASLTPGTPSAVAMRISAVTAGFGDLFQPSALSASSVQWSECGEEILAAAGAVAYAVVRWAIWRALPTWGNLMRAVAATGVAILASAIAGDCVDGTSQSLDPGY